MSTEVTTTRPTDPLAIIAQAIETGKIDADSLGKLMDLVERVEHRRAVAAFNSAMRQCQADMPPVLKSKPNSHLGNMYAELEAIVATAKPVYTQHGFSLSFSERDGAADGHCRVCCTVRHAEGHSEEHWADYPIDGVGAKGGKVMNALQGRVSSHSYAQKDLIRQLFAMVIAGADSDGNTLDTLIADEVAELRALIKAKGRDEHEVMRFWKCGAFDEIPRSQFKALMMAVQKLTPKEARAEE